MYTLLGGGRSSRFNGTTLRDYRLKNSSCFYDYYINALSMPSKNGITPIKVTPASSVHGRV